MSNNNGLNIKVAFHFVGDAAASGVELMSFLDLRLGGTDLSVYSSYGSNLVNSRTYNGVVLVAAYDLPLHSVLQYFQNILHDV